MASACGRPVERRGGGPATVPRAAPHDLDRRVDRRRHAAAARGGDARPPWRPLPRRAAGVRARRARGACASRSRTARSGSSGRATRSSCRAASSSIAAANPCPCGRGARSGSCTCDPERDPCLRGEAHRGAGRPDRHLARGRAARPGVVRRSRRGLRRGARPGPGRARASARADRRRPSQRGAGAVGDPDRSARSKRLLAAAGAPGA